MLRKYLTYLLVLISVSVFAGSESNLLRFNHFTVENGLSQNTILTIAKDKYGFMWFGTWEGISRFDGYSFHVFRADQDNPHALTNNRIDAIICDSAGDIWVRTGDSRYIFKYNYASENFTRFATEKIPPGISRQFEKYSSSKKIAWNKHYRWRATSAGLLQINKKTKATHMYRVSTPESPFDLTDEVINVVYLDNCNNLWVGTQNEGIDVANLRFKQFKYYSVGNAGLSDHVIRAVTQDKSGRLWVGTDADGITVIDRQNNKTIYYGKNSLINPHIRSLFCDKYGFVWIGTKGGLDRFDPRTGKFRHYYANAPGSINAPWVFCIMQDHEGNLWVGTFAGLAKYDYKHDRFLCYDPAKTLPNPKVRAIIEDHHHSLWIGTEGGGVTKLTRDTTSGFAEKLTPHFYQYKADNTNSMINDLVLTMLQDDVGNIWIGTNSGLCRLNPETGKFTRFSVATGFPDDLIMGLLPDHHGHIWISHKKGLTCMNIHTLKFTTYNKFDGLQGNEFNQNAYYRNPVTGEMFFGGANGLNSFFPNQIVANAVKPRPVLTGLKIMNEPIEPGKPLNNHLILKQSLLCTHRITLKWSEMNFSLSFSSLNYDNPQGCHFKYKLEGIDNQWIYTDAAMREATYTHIPAGLYTFEVFAANSDGIWSSHPATLQIRVLPPWWLSWWAELIYFMFAAIVAWLIYRYISTRIEYRNKLLMERLKNEKNEELMNMKLQFFTEISHEFRTPLTLIIDPLEQLIEGKTDKEQVQFYYELMNRNAKQLLELINQLLDFRKLQTGNLPVKFVRDDLVAFVKNVAAAFEHKAHERQVRFVVLPAEDKLEISFDQDKLRKILNNLISNAFRFTPDYGEIVVEISLKADDPENVFIEVRDNGQGISPEHLEHIFDAFYQEEGAASTQGTGLGLALTKELVLLHGGTIIVESEKGNGACFKITMPVSHESTVEVEQPTEQEVADNDAKVIADTRMEHDENGLPLLLVVDDNPDIRKYIQLNFKNAYRVITANNGLEGYNLAVETIPDLIISDIMMPEVDGIEFCKRIKTDEFTSHIPVILLTARLSDESKVEGYETGADAYITKPFSKKVLEARMSNLLEQRMKLRQLFSAGTTPEIEKISVNVTDEAFLNKVVSLVHNYLDDPDFDQEQLADKMKMSRSQLYRKIKALTNRTPGVLPGGR